MCEHSNRTRITRASCARGVHCALLGLLVFFVWCSVAAKEPSEKRAVITPDAQIQAQLQRLLSVSNADDWAKDLDRLAKMAGRNYEKLVPQLLYYSMYGKDAEGRHDVVQAMAPGVIAKKLEIHESHIASALVPYLGTDDPRLKKELFDLFSAFNFSGLQSMVDAQVRSGEDVPYELIRVMYQSKPGESLCLVGSTALPQRLGHKPTQQRRALVWAEHVVSEVLWKHKHGFLDKRKSEPEASAQLERLSKDDAWWVRLYVAEIMRQHPAFRTPELVSRLKDDPHNLVREAMDFTRQKPKESPKTPDERGQWPSAKAGPERK